MYKLIQDKNFWDTERRNCNCGSFALNAEQWVTPYDNDEENNGDIALDYTEEDRRDDMNDLLFMGYSKEDIENSIVEGDAAYILEHTPWIEQVNYEDVAPDERLIAYRIFITLNDENTYIEDEDFHFRVRIDGKWYEKNGVYRIHECAPDDGEGRWQSSPYCYDSEIIYFRVKDEFKS